MPDQPLYRSQVLDHLGLVAGMFDELGIGDVIDQATQQDPQMRDLTVGEAGKAMVLNGLGFVNQALSLVPSFFHNKPTYQLMSPRVTSHQLNDDALGRALDTLYAYGVTELSTLLAASAAKRLGLGATYVHLDSTSFHVDGRYNGDDPPAEHVVHITQGSRRDHRPDLNQVMVALIVAHQAGIPVLMKPLSGNSSDAKSFAQTVSEHIQQVQSTYGTTYLVADSALYSAENLGILQDTHAKWITRVPATVNDAQVALAQADPDMMAPLKTGYRYQTLHATYGDVAQRWLLLYSEPRRLQAQRTVTTRWLKYSAKEVKAFPKLCRTDFACEADARQAVDTFENGLQYTALQEVITVRATPRYDKPGRPKADDIPRRDPSTTLKGLSPRRWRLVRRGWSKRVVLFWPRMNSIRPPLAPLEFFEAYQGQTTGRTRLPIPHKPRVSGRIALPQKARADYGPVDGHDGVFAGLCRVGVPHASGSPGS